MREVVDNMNNSPTIRIIIPVYQDRAALETLLPALLGDWRAEEVVVVDAGDDGSEAFAKSLGVTVIRSVPGRAKQMNAGAGHAVEADLLLFLHADTRLPPEAGERLSQAYADGIVGGAFSRRFDSPSRFLKLTCALADVRGKTLGLFLGDQAIFARKDVFERIGGFPDQPLFEDLDFCRTLKKEGRVRLLTPPVRSSARRFDKDGPLLRTLKDVTLTLRHLYAIYTFIRFYQDFPHFLTG